MTRRITAESPAFLFDDETGRRIGIKQPDGSEDLFLLGRDLERDVTPDANTVVGSSQDIKTPVFTFERKYDKQATFRPWTVLFYNQGELDADPNDYQNEVHVVLKAGATRNHRRYINWVGYNDATHFILGVNAQNDFVIHDHVSGIHRLSFFAEANGGHTLINSSGENSVIRFGYHQNDTVPALRVRMYRGGATAAATLAHDFAPEFYAVYNNAGDITAILKADTGRLALGHNNASQLLDVNDDSIRVRTSKTPASASDTGAAGQFGWDASYFYVCTATNTWRRTAHATW